MVAALPKSTAICKRECQNMSKKGCTYVQISGYINKRTNFKAGTKDIGCVYLEDRGSVEVTKQLPSNYGKGRFCYVKHNLVTGLLSALCLVVFVICLSTRFFIDKEYAWFQQQVLLDKNIVSEFYVPCELLSLSFEDDFDTFDSTKHGVKLYRDDKGRRICSFTNLTHVVERATEREARLRVAEGLARPEYLSCGNVSKRPQSGENIAYFTKLTGSGTDQTGQHDDILHWSTDPDSSFTGSGISYENNRVRVNASQFYFVYASVTFNKSSLLQDSSGYSQSVFYMNVEIATVYKGEEYSVRSLNIAETIKGCDDGVGTVYLGSQIFLDKRNILFVSVSESKRVVLNSHGNRFGLYVN